MEFTNIIIFFIGLALGILTLNIIVDIIDAVRGGRAKKQDDRNITFKNGISLEKKQYPSMKDDWREGVYVTEKKEDDGNQSDKN